MCYTSLKEGDVPMTNLKDSRQLDVLQFIYKEVQEHGYPPTVREICNAVQLSSTSTVHGHLSRLEKNTCH